MLALCFAEQMLYFVCMMFLNLAVHFQGNFKKHWSHWQNIKIRAESSWRHLQPCLVWFYLHNQAQINRNVRWWALRFWGTWFLLIGCWLILPAFSLVLFSIWEPNWWGTPRLQERHRTVPVPLWVKSLK